jgi:O-antigen/teichoic acid export membrane protein
MTGRGEDLRRKAAAGVVWTALQKWSVRLSSFIAFLVLGRLLDPSDFGVVALASAFIVLMTTLADAGFATYLVQAKELSREAQNTAFYIATSSGLALFAVGCAIAYPLSVALHVSQLRLVLPVLSLSLVFIGLSSVPAAMLTRELRFQALAMRQVIATVASVVVAILAALAGWGVWALVVQYLVLRVVTTAVLWFATDFRPRRGFSRPEARNMLGYSLKAMGAQLLSQGRDQGEVLLIGAIAGPVALGLYTIASRLVLVIGDVLGTVLGSVAVPLFARVQSEPRRLGRAIAGTSGAGMLMLSPVLVTLALLSPQLIPQVFGHQWRGATTVAALLALRGIFVAQSQLDRAVLLNAGRAGAELRLIAVLTTVHVVLVASLAGQGIEVLGVALLAEAVLVAPLRPIYVRRLLGVPLAAYVPGVRVALATGISGLLTFLALRMTHADHVAAYGVVVAVGLLSYPPLVLLIARGPLQESWEALRLVLRRRAPVAS